VILIEQRERREGKPRNHSLPFLFSFRSLFFALFTHSVHSSFVKAQSKETERKSKG